MPKNLTNITCEHLLKLRKDKEKEHVVVDLRDVLEYESGHIEGSLNVPRKELETNLASVVPQKTAKVVVVVGPTQQEEIGAIADHLSALGYSDVEFLSGGFDKWCEIAPLELEPELTETTPEERGATGTGNEEEIDPHVQEDEPLM